MAYAIEVRDENHFSLKDVDPDRHGGLDREKGEEMTSQLGKRFWELMDLHYASGSESLLIALQGRDTAGKDGLIRDLLGFINPQSVTVTPFKVPTAEELGHDFLWRVHKEVPRKGYTAIFNRSHYEDVLAVRVHNLAPKAVWNARFGQINDFEELLVANKTILLKFCLHISKDEQESRLRAREADPQKAWKLSAGDWKEREFWDDYTEAYNDVLTKCGTKTAPWYVIPANHKWFRTLAVVEQIVSALEPFEKRWQEELDEIGAAALKEIKAYRNDKPNDN